MDYKTLPTLNRVSHNFRKLLNSDPRFEAYMRDGHQLWYMCVMENGMPRLRVFDPSIFLDGTVRFTGGRVCSHDARLTIFRGALIRETGSIDTENGRYCISNVGCCRYNGAIPEKVWLRKFTFPTCYKVYQVTTSTRVSLYGTIGSNSLVVSMTPTPVDREIDEVNVTKEDTEIPATSANEVPEVKPAPIPQMQFQVERLAGVRFDYNSDGTTDSESSDEFEKNRLFDSDFDSETDEFESESDTEDKKMSFGIPDAGVEGASEGQETGEILYDYVKEIEVRRARYNGYDCIGLLL